MKLSLRDFTCHTGGHVQMSWLKRPVKTASLGVGLSSSLTDVRLFFFREMIFNLDYILESPRELQKLSPLPWR